MKAAVLKDAFRVEIEQVPQPTVGEQDVLIKVKASGICGSDLHAYKGVHPFRKPPVILGHEVAGEVVAIGKAVRAIKVGDRVTVEPHISCGRCSSCRKSLPNLCRHKVVPGVGNWLGAFAEYFAAPESQVYVLPDSLSYDGGALVEPLAVAVRSVRRSRLAFGESVAILGSGPIGLLIAMLARKAGARPVMATDILPYNLSIANSVGAVGVNVTQEDLYARGAVLTNEEGFDVVFVTSGTRECLNEAVQLAGPCGRVVVIAMFNSELPITPYRVVSTEQAVIGALTYTPDDFQKAMDLLAQSEMDLTPLITRHVSLEQLDEELKAIAHRTHDTIKSILVFQP